MSLTLEGRVVQVVRSERTDRTTGEVKKRFYVEVFHFSKGRSEVAKVVVDESAAAAWEKIAGNSEKLGELVRVEVVPYAIKTEKGEILAGLTCVDSKAMPVVSRALKAA